MAGLCLSSVETIKQEGLQYKHVSSATSCSVSSLQESSFFKQVMGQALRQLLSTAATS